MESSLARNRNIRDKSLCRCQRGGYSSVESAAKASVDKRSRASLALNIHRVSVSSDAGPTDSLCGRVDRCSRRLRHDDR